LCSNPFSNTALRQSVFVKNSIHPELAYRGCGMGLGSPAFTRASRSGVYIGAAPAWMFASLSMTAIW